MSAPSPSGRMGISLTMMERTGEAAKAALPGACSYAPPLDGIDRTGGQGNGYYTTSTFSATPASPTRCATRRCCPSPSRRLAPSDPPRRWLPGFSPDWRIAIFVAIIFVLRIARRHLEHLRDGEIFGFVANKNFPLITSLRYPPLLAKTKSLFQHLTAARG